MKSRPWFPLVVVLVLMGIWKVADLVFGFYLVNQN